MRVMNMKGQAQDSVIYENLIKCNNYSMNSNWFSRTKKKTFVIFGKFGNFSIKFLIPQMTLVFTHWHLNDIKSRVHLIVGFIGGLMTNNRFILIRMDVCPNVFLESKMLHLLNIHYIYPGVYRRDTRHCPTRTCRRT